jgi:hypothetical protein
MRVFGELGVTLAGQPFKHLLYHLTLTYSNWEWGQVCFSESFESLAAGVQDALWELGGVPQEHRTDSLSAAVRPPRSKEEFTEKYQGLLQHLRDESQPQFAWAGTAMWSNRITGSSGRCNRS